MKRLRLEDASLKKGMAFRRTVSDPDKGKPLVYYYPHSVPVTCRAERWSQERYYQVVSIDPATRNFALRVERRYPDGRVETLVYTKVDLDPKSAKPKKGSAGEYVLAPTPEGATPYDRLIVFLDLFKPYYEGCHILAIERQLPLNYKMVRMSQHAITYFSLYLRDKPLLPVIVEISPKLKGQQLGAPPGLGDKQLKEWAVQVARAILTARGDTQSLTILDSVKKRDDLADTVCQIEAFFKYLNMGPTHVPSPITVTPPPIDPKEAEANRQALTNFLATPLPAVRLRIVG